MRPGCLRRTHSPNGGSALTLTPGNFNQDLAALGWLSLLQGFLTRVTKTKMRLLTGCVTPQLRCVDVSPPNSPAELRNKNQKNQQRWDYKKQLSTYGHRLSTYGL